MTSNLDDGETGAVAADFELLATEEDPTVDEEAAIRSPAKCTHAWTEMSVTTPNPQLLRILNSCQRATDVFDVTCGSCEQGLP